MVYIKGSNKQLIELTRGNSEVYQVGITINGEEYTPVEGDVVTFAMRRGIVGIRPWLRYMTVLEKDIPINTMQLTFEPEDTKYLPFGKYVYTIKITFADGSVKTFVKPSPFIITEEVD